MNDLSIKGFILEDLKSKITQLDEENRGLELKTMDLESYENLSNRAEELKMVKVDNIDYIVVGSDEVAKK